MCVIECEVICTAPGNLNIWQKWLGYDQSCCFWRGYIYKSSPSSSQTQKYEFFQIQISIIRNCYFDCMGYNSCGECVCICLANMPVYLWKILVIKWDVSFSGIWWQLCESSNRFLLFSLEKTTKLCTCSVQESHEPVGVSPEEGQKADRGLEHTFDPEKRRELGSFWRRQGSRETCCSLTIYKGIKKMDKESLSHLRQSIVTVGSICGYCLIQNTHHKGKDFVIGFSFQHP